MFSFSISVIQMAGWHQKTKRVFEIKEKKSFNIFKLNNSFTIKLSAILQQQVYAASLGEITENLGNYVRLLINSINSKEQAHQFGGVLLLCSVSLYT